MNGPDPSRERSSRTRRALAGLGPGEFLPPRGGGYAWIVGAAFVIATVLAGLLLEWRSLP